jgi:hypothetical protein
MIWYARPREMMNTPEDLANIERIQKMYPRQKVDYARPSECRRGEPKSMIKFFRRVDKASSVIVVEHARHAVTAGVFAEAQHAVHLEIPVLVLRSSGTKASLLPVQKLKIRRNPVHAGKYATLSL